MTRRATVLVWLATLAGVALAAALATRLARSDEHALSDAQTPPRDCADMWRRGVELHGVVGRRETQAYFDMAPIAGAPEQVSGIVLFPDERADRPLADAAVGLAGGLNGAPCRVHLSAHDKDADAGMWLLRIDSADRVTGTRVGPDGTADAVRFRIVPHTPCDGAGAWRMYRSPAWPITFDYPADWVLTADADDVNIECPSVARLAAGGSWLTFERGRLAAAKAAAATERQAHEPYWFVRLREDDWRVLDAGCADRAAEPAPGRRCPPARQSVRGGITILQGAAGDHRLYRSGVGDLGPGGGITRYLFVLGDEWVSLDSAGSTAHHDDIGSGGGPVLLDGNAVGDRIVRSIKTR